VEAHDFFRRDNTDIICQVPISFIQATLGDKISVPTMDGKKALSIPKGTQPGEIFRFRGEGIASLRNGHRGDQIIQIIVKTPTHLTKKQEALLKEFSKLESGKLTTKLKNIFKGNPVEAAQ
jgi:molecular chaperone DnaJ